MAQKCMKIWCKKTLNKFVCFGGKCNIDNIKMVHKSFSLFVGTTQFKQHKTTFKQIFCILNWQKLAVFPYRFSWIEKNYSFLHTETMCHAKLLQVDGVDICVSVVSA